MLSLTFVHHTCVLLPPVILAGLILTGCSGGTVQPALHTQNEAVASSEYYLRRSQQGSDADKTGWQLLAIRALLLEGKNTQAAEELSRLPRDLRDFQYQEQQLLAAELQAVQKNNSAAYNIFTKLKPESLSVNQQLRYWQLQSSINQGKPTLALVRAYIARQALLNNDDEENPKNIDNTWQAMIQLTPQELKHAVIHVDEYTLQGWLDLLDTWQNNKQDPVLLKEEIKNWQTRYPQNPAAKTLPTQLDEVNKLMQEPTRSIALLLPLSGSAKTFGTAIQQGFIAAKNGVPPTHIRQRDIFTGIGNQEDDIDHPEEASHDNAMPVAESELSTGNIQIKTYDTSLQSISSLLDKARQDGAFMVVGPLLKSDIAQVLNVTTSLPILALNQPEMNKNNPDICYFALSPEDEARDAAQHIWRQQKRTPLLLLPRGMFGDRIARAFMEKWHHQGGLTVAQQTFGSISELKQMINHHTGILLTGSPVSGVHGKSSALVSSVIDAIYIVATPDELTLIKPMIDMATTSSVKPALFAHSRSYQADAGPGYRLEMEGMQFSDIPFMANISSTLMQQTIAKLNNDYSLVRLYAMGMDAWMLAQYFAQIPLTDFRMAGFTGKLSTTPGCIVQRELSWFEYRNGRVIPVTS